MVSLTAAAVDHGIEAPPVERAQIAVTVADQSLNVRK